jgi:hypothetical protein
MRKLRNFATRVGQCRFHPKHPPPWSIAGTMRSDAKTGAGRCCVLSIARPAWVEELNTFLVSLYLAPLGDGDLAWMASLSRRLDRMRAVAAVAPRDEDCQPPFLEGRFSDFISQRNAKLICASSVSTFAV